MRSEIARIHLRWRSAGGRKAKKFRSQPKGIAGGRYEWRNGLSWHEECRPKFGYGDQPVFLFLLNDSGLDDARPVSRILAC